MRRGLLPVVLLAGAATACASRGLTLPTGEGETFPGYGQAWQEGTSHCRVVRSLSAELVISGRVGRERLRGHVLAGLSAPDRIRLEAAAPFGPPVFILVADGATATLLLPRDNRVLRGEPVAAILEALVGLDLGPSDLLAILSGCVLRDARATGGRIFPSGWARVDMAGGARVFLLQAPPAGWRIRAGVRPPLGFEYQLGADGMPTAVRLRADADGGSGADVRIGLSQVAFDPSLGSEVFSVRVPSDAAPISLTELRQAGPIGEK